MSALHGRGATRLPVDAERVRLLAAGIVIAEPGRCVQCGVCEYNCPMGVGTRAYARRGLPITDPACILCGSCVARCPRGTLRFAWADEIGSGARADVPRRVEEAA